MKRVLIGTLALALGIFLITSTGIAQPPGGGKEGGKGGPGGFGGGMRGGFKVGVIIPPQMIEQLKLTDEQKTKLAEIEKKVKAELDAMLTDEQKKILETPRGPGGEGRGGAPGGRGEGRGPGGPGGKGPGGEKGPAPAPKPEKP